MTNTKPNTKPKKAGRPKVKKVGRPTVMTDHVLSMLRAAFLIGATDEEACAYAEIGTTAFYAYQAENPEFAEKKDRWKQQPILQAKQTVVGALKSDKDTAKWYLERKKKDEFSTRQEVTGADGDAVKMELDKLEEKSNYDKLGQQVEQQGMETNPPVQDQGQAGEASDVPAESNPDTPHQGEGVAQEESDSQSEAARDNDAVQHRPAG